MAEAVHVPSELKDAVTRLVDQRFGGDWERAFQQYARNTGVAFIMEKEDALLLLTDAGIDDPRLRDASARGIIKGFTDNSTEREGGPMDDHAEAGHEIKWADLSRMMRE
jgi:hypothetical protein